MTIRVTARSAGMEEEPDNECLSAGFSENADGSGFVLILQCPLFAPDEQDVALGMDSYCLITADQSTYYGGVVEASLQDRTLRIVLTPCALEPLNLDDPEIEATMDVEDRSIERLREGLGRVLRYGRPADHPAMLLI